jgi:phage-related protein
MAAVQAEAAKSKVDVPVKPADLDDFAKRIKAEAEKLARQIEVAVPATFEGEKFRRDAAAKIEALSKTLELKVPMDLESAVNFRRHVLDQMAEVEAIAKGTHPTVHMRVDVDKSILTRLKSGFGEVEKGVSAASDAVLEMGGSIGKLALGFVSNLNPAAVALTAAIAAAVPLAADMVASLGPSLLVAVPALAAAGAAIGVIALGSKQLGTAFKPLTSRVDALKTSVGNLLAAGVRPLVAEFVDKAMPTIQRGLGKIASTMNGFIKDFLSWAGSAPTVKLIGDVFTGLNSAMKPLSGAAQAFADALLRIVKDAAPGLKLVTDTIKNLAVRFDGFIKSKDKDGSLTKTISDSIEAAGKLVGALVNLGRAVGGLFADIGKGSTSGLTDGINGIATAIQHFVDNGGGKAIHDFLVGAGQAVKDYFSSGQFQQTMADISTDAANIRDLTTSLKGLSDGLSGFGAAVSPFKDFAETLNGLLHFDPMTLASTFAPLVPAMANIWVQITSITSSSWAAISGIISGWWNNITGFTAGAIAQVIAAVARAWVRIQESTSAAWTAVSGTVSGWWKTITSTVSGGVNAVVGFVKSLPGRVTGSVSSAWAQVTSLTSSGWARAAAAVSTGVTNAVNFVKGLPGKAVGALAGLASSLFNAAFQAGYNLLQGLMAGIRALWGSVTSLVSNLASSISSTFSRVMQIHSPSRVMQQLGAFVAQGLIVGMTGSQTQVAAAAAKLGSLVQSAVNSYLSQKSSLAKKIAADAAAVDKARTRYAQVVTLHGITATNAINSARDAVARANAKYETDKSKKGVAAATLRKDADAIGKAQDHLQTVIKQQGTRTAIAVTNARTALQKAIAKLAGDKTDLTALNKSFGALGDPKVVALVTKVTKNYEGVLAKIAAAREDLATRLKDAQSKLADAMKIRDDYAASVRQATVDFANLTRAQAQEGAALTSQDVITNLRQKLAAINDFRNNIRALQAEGLSNDALKQLVDAGVEAGGATAAALVQGGQAAVSEVNNLTASISSAADDLGTTTAQQFFGAGVAQAQGLVNGLQAQSAQLESQAAQIAQAMVNAIKAVFAGASYDYGFHDKVPLTVNGKKAGVQAPPVQVVVNNPVPETASQSTTRIMRSLATFGAGAPIYVPAR